MRSTKELSGIASEDIQQAALSDDNDFRLGMGEIGKSVTLLWPANIERILSGDDFVALGRETVGKAADDDRDEIANKEGTRGVCDGVA